MTKRSFGFELLRIADDIVSNTNSAITLLEESSKLNNDNLDAIIVKFKAYVYELKVNCALALEDPGAAEINLDRIFNKMNRMLSGICLMVWKHVVNVSNAINDILNITNNPVYSNTPEENINVARKLFS